MKYAAVCIALAAFVILPGCDKAHSDSVRETNKGMRALAQNQTKVAREHFTQAVDIYPENAKAHYGLGVVLMESGELVQARRHLREATKLSPDLTEAFFQLGAIAMKEEKLDTAETVLRRTLEQEPDHDAAQLLMGRIHERKGELKEAEVAFRKSITLNPLLPESFLRLARLYLRVSAESEAELVLREGIRLNPVESLQNTANLSLLHNELGIMRQAEGKYGEAADEMLKAVRMPGAAPEVAFNLGWAYASQGETELALRYFNQYIGLADANDPSVRVAIDVAKHLAEQLRAARQDG